MKVKTKLSRLYSHYPRPKYATPGSAGLDLRADIAGEMSISPGKTTMVGTGVSIWLDDPGYTAIALPRSGLGTRGLILGNVVGLVDSDYQGEVMLSLWNRTDRPITIQQGQEVAQLVIVPVVRAEFDVMDDFGDVVTERGAGGFGSTGRTWVEELAQQP